MKIKILRPVIAITQVLLIMVTMFPATILADETEDISCAVLGSSVQVINANVRMGDNPDISVVEKNGKEGWLLKPMDSARYLYYNVSNKIFYRPDDGTGVVIDVEYYDEGQGSFALEYDGLNGITTYPDLVYNGNTCKWKTYSFMIQDPNFADAMAGGTDFRLSMFTPVMQYSKDNVVIGSIKVRKLNTKSVAIASFTSDSLGNMFYTGQGIKFNVTIKGKVKKAQKLKITYSAIDSNGKVGWSDEETLKISVLPYTRELHPKVDRYDIYTLQVTFENKELGIYGTSQTQFSYIRATDGKVANKDFNVCSHFGHYYPNSSEAMKMMNMAGIGGTRDGIYWSNFEKQKGVYALDNQHDTFYSEAAKNNVDVLHVLAFGNGLYNNTTGNMKSVPYSDEELKAWSDFCYNIALQTRGRSQYFEVWNEYNVGFNPDGYPPEHYAKLLKYTYPAIKKGNPDAIVVGLGFVGVPADWINRVYKAGGGDYMDVVSIHPYMWEGNPTGGDLAGKVKMLEDIVRSNGYNQKIWITEMGWGSFDNVTTEDQTSYMVQSFVLSRGIPSMEKFFWYDFQNDGYMTIDREHNFGLINYWNTVQHPWAAKPSYLAASNMNIMLAGAQYQGNVKLGEQAYIYKFKRGYDGKTVYVLWGANKNSAVALSGNKDSIDIYDMYGNTTKLNAVNGKYSLVVDKSVAYIEGDGLELNTGDPVVLFDQTYLYSTPNEVINIYAEKKATDDIKIEIDTQKSDIEVVENVGFKDNKAIITLKTKDEAIGTKKKFKVNLYDGGKIVMASEFTVEYIKAVDVKLSNNLYSVKNFNRWMGVLDISNNSHSEAIQGKMEITAPAWLAGQLAPVPINKINPQETKEIKFHFPEVFRKEMYTLQAVLRFDNGYTQQLSQRIDFTVAPYAAKPPIIDGVMEDGEWPVKAAMMFDQPFQLVINPGFTWKGLSDLSGKVCVMWDEKYYYMAAKVEDDIHYQPETSDILWKADSVQFAVAYEKANGLSNSTASTEVGMALSPIGEIIYTYLVENVTIHLGKVETADLKIKRVGTTTTYEIRMPWSSIMPENAKIEGGKRLAFSMLVNDNDGAGRKGWMEYASGIGLNKNTNLFTFLQLLKKE